ncbi:hypothetical protein JI435_412550, partial [Parastagonospora nodorum SN15]
FARLGHMGMGTGVYYTCFGRQYIGAPHVFFLFRASIPPERMAGSLLSTICERDIIYGKGASHLGKVRADVQNHIYSYLPSPLLYEAGHLVSLYKLDWAVGGAFFVPVDKILFFSSIRKIIGGMG